MGVYIEGLDRPRNEYMRIHIDFDGEHGVISSPFAI